jgi:hypothetical protein
VAQKSILAYIIYADCCKRYFMLEWGASRFKSGILLTRKLVGKGNRISSSPGKHFSPFLSFSYFTTLFLKKEII